jgi:23S rRNA (adenine2503-C2)-methyltransferase
MPPPKQIIKLASKLDDSVNFVLPNGQETRYVRRQGSDYIIVYLSSHNGCNKSCRFCHLTQTNQTDFVSASYTDMVIQAITVLQHYEKEVKEGRQTPVEKVHFNWMARGEPLSNQILFKRWTELSNELIQIASEFGLKECNFNISSIFPKLDDGKERQRVYLIPSKTNTPTIYYSLYSLNENFRKRWLPKAEEPVIALTALVDWQRYTGGSVVLHWAFIKGDNDSKEQVQEIINLVKASGLIARFNLVRYNPFSSNQGQESSEEVVQERFKQLSEAMKVPGSRIVPRVGFDVAASCGMFIKQ